MRKPVNPIIIDSQPESDCPTTVVVQDITLRDLFAAAALAGLLGNSSHDNLEPDEWASDAGRMADAMLEERAKS